VSFKTVVFLKTALFTQWNLTGFMHILAFFPLFAKILPPFSELRKKPWKPAD
jgi:hypothetical protein